MRFCRSIALLLALFVAPAPLLAAPPDPQETRATEDREQQYSQHMTNGVRLFRLDDFAGALVEFEAAYQSVPKASPLINQALAYRKLGKYDRAVERLELALAKHETTMSQEDKAAATRAASELRALFAYAEVKVTPKTAQLTLDGEPLTKLSPVVLSPGEHVFEATLPGWLTTRKTVRTASGDRVEVELVLVQERGKLRVVAAGKNSAIFIDGKQVGHGTWEGDLPAGPHEVKVLDEATRTVTLAHQATTVVDLSATNKLPPVPPAPSAPKEPTDEPIRGFLMRVDGAILFPLRHPEFFDQPEFDDLSRVSSGSYVSARAGYRVHTFAGFEGLVEYGNVQGPANGTGEQSYSLSSVRVGPLVRLMSPGETIRFLGTLGGGLAVHLMSYENLGAEACPGIADADCSSAGADFFVMTELGFEVDLDGVLLGLSVAAYLSGTKGINDFQEQTRVEALIKEPYDNRILPMIGPRVHFGYGFW